MCRVCDGERDGMGFSDRVRRSPGFIATQILTVATPSDDNTYCMTSSGK